MKIIYNIKKYLANFNFQNKKYKIILLSFICLLTFIFLFQKVIEIKNFRIMGTRLNSCNTMLSSLFQGYPQFSRYYADGTVTKYPNYGDDKGIFIIVPWLAYHFNWSIIEAAQNFTGFMLALSGVIVLLLLYLIFNSLLLSFLSSILLLFHPSFQVLFNGFDFYWIQGWIVLIGVWLLILLYKRWKSTHNDRNEEPFHFNIKSIIKSFDLINLVLVILISTLSSFANLIRVKSGLSVFASLIILLFILYFKSIIKDKRKILNLLFLIIISSVFYLSIFPVISNIIVQSSYNKLYKLAKTDKNIKISNKISTAAAHQMWHNIYIGLGYVPNKYGLKWDDGVAYNYVMSVNPNVYPISPEYENILKKRVFELAKEDPDLIWRNIKKKLLVIKDATIRYNSSIVLLFLFIFFIFLRSAYTGIFLIINIPIIGISILPALLTIPHLNYLLGWHIIWFNFLIFGIYLFLKNIEKLKLFFLLIQKSYMNIFVHKVAD